MTGVNSGQTVPIVTFKLWWKTATMKYVVYWKRSSNSEHFKVHGPVARTIMPWAFCNWKWRAQNKQTKKASTISLSFKFTLKWFHVVISVQTSNTVILSQGNKNLITRTAKRRLFIWPIYAVIVCITDVSRVDTSTHTWTCRLVTWTCYRSCTININVVNFTNHWPIKT